MSGINVFAFLAATILSRGGAGSTPLNSLLLAFGFAASNAIFSTIAFWIVDVKGRRFLLLASLLAMIPLLVATACSLLITREPVRNGVVAMFLFLYTAAYSPGAGVVPFLYCSEAFPLIHREAGMSLGCFVNFSLGGLLVFFVPLATFGSAPESMWGNSRLLGLFA